MRALYDANGSLLAVSIAPVGQDGLAELLRDRELIVDLIICNAMHCSTPAGWLGLLPSGSVALRFSPTWRKPLSADGPLNSGRESVRAWCRTRSDGSCP